MPISRYNIRSPHGLADPELHRAADKEDSEALLEAVAMTGLVGLLRQLGDLSEFAAELFHNLHEEVMTTAERGHSLKSRVQQLEAEIPALEKAFLSETHHSSFFTNRGIDWHPNLRSEQNLVACGDLPRFVLNSYEECRGPPRLFLLDKFDAAGAGACLKRYTDPSLFKAESASSVTAVVCREKRILKVKKKGARLRNGEAAKFVSSHSKLHQLFLEDHIENAFSDPARLVKLRKKQLDGSAVEANTGKSYMEKILEMPSPDHKMVRETSFIPLPVKSISDDTIEVGIKILDINSTSPVRSLRNPKTSRNEQKLEMNSCSEIDRKPNGNLVNGHEEISASMTAEMSSNHLKVPVETELVDDEQKKRECSLDGYGSDDAISEIDDYMDALATIDSELETDNECRPKKILLNVQKVTDSNSIEHQQQARISDSQSSKVSSISEEISSCERDQNEEHNEVQAWLPDSQSAGTRCESDDNCSFRRGINEEHTHAQFSDSQSIGSSSSEKENIPSNQLPQTVELQKTCGEFVTCDYAHDQEEIIPDSSPVSSGSCLKDSGCLLFPSDIGATSLMSLPKGTQSDETPSVPVELHFKSEDGEDRMCLVESIATESYAPSPIKDNTCPVISFDNSSLCNLDICDPYVHSNLHISNDLNMVHNSDCDDHSDIKILQTESLTEYSVISVVGDIGTRGEDPICLAMEEDLNSGTELLLDDQNLNSEEDIIKTQLNSEDSFPVVETTLESSFTEDPICLATEGDLNSDTKLLVDDQNLNSEEHIKKTQFNSKDPFPVVETTLECSFTEELCSDLTLDLPNMAEVGVLYPVRQSNFEEIPRVMPGHEINGFTCCLHPDEDDGHIKHPPSPNYMRQDIHGMVTDKFSVKVQSEDQAVTALPCVEIAENHASNVNYLVPVNLSNLHEPFLGSSDSHQMQMELNEVELTKNSIDLNAEKMENQLVPSSETVSSSMSSLTKLEESLSFADPLEKKRDVNEAGARESFTELSAHQVVEIASTNELVNLRRSVRCDPSDSGIYNNVQHSSLEEKIQYGSSLYDTKMVTECSELDSQRSESMFVWQNNLQNNNNCLSPPSCNQLESETHSHLLLKSQAQLRNEENYTPSKFQPQMMQISNKLEQERISHAASEFAAELHPDEISCGSSSKSSAQQTNSTEHVMDPLKPLLPDPFPKETKINLEETPPMPPLPPMQWIMSKVQNASQVSQREEIDVGQVSCQPMQPLKPDYKSEFGLSPSKRVTLPYQNPFLPVVVAVESNNLLHSSGLSEAVSEHPVAIPLQFSLLVNEETGQHHYLSQTQNPFLTLPVVSLVRLPHGSVIASEEESVLNSTPCAPILPAECAVSKVDPNFQQEKPTQFSNQLLEDTSLEPKKDRTEELHLVLPAECPVFGDDSSSPKEKPEFSNQLLEDTSLEPKKDRTEELHLVLPAECPVSGDDSSSPKEKPAKPPNEMEENNLEVKTLEQSSINLERKHGDPLITPVSPPSIEIVQTNHSPVPSEGELALSMDTSPQSSEFDSEMSNGNPKNKLPHPPNPLIDIAATLDKSRLRKASDRVRPQIAPKVDERDSLLEQIRSKSFNLKPAMVTRPSIQGPRTNLRVAAILEKANAIRQAFAGSDEDDDADSWSDS